MTAGSHGDQQRGIVDVSVPVGVLQRLGLRFCVGFAVRLKIMLLLLGVSACSMQPLIDASLPPVEPRPAGTDQTASPDEGKSPPASDSETEQPRAVTVAAQQALPPAAQSLRATATQMRQRDDYSGAVVQLERALKIAPRSPQLYFELAQTYHAMGNSDSARVFAQKALSVGPDRQLRRAINRFVNMLR